MLSKVTQPPDAPPVLELDRITKRYGDVVALDGVSLRVHAGDVVCLLGANGAGKTTTLHALLGFVEPTSGHARVQGHEVQRDVHRARRHLAFIPEVVVLYDHLTGRENLEFLCALGGTTPPAAELHDCLLRAGLPKEAIARRVGTYSKGMRQKVGIALALARRASALLLDEPLSGLDPKAASELVQTIRQQAQSGRAVLMATHDLHRSMEVATRIGIVKAGRLVEELEPSALTAADLEAIYLQHMRD